MCPLKKRTYRMKKRADLAAETRLRITKSAMELHERLGPAQASVSAIAEHAGVRRATLYRHFPDERALFAACSGQWRAENPVPDLGRWAAIPDFEERLESALGELYAYYRRTERMLTKVYRDEEAMPAVREKLGEFRGYLAAARATLLAGQERSGPTLAALIGHALSFPVWRSLGMEQGLDDDACARLMCALVRAAAKE